MQLLSWELSILARAIAFSNLSAASRQIGMSQPQLSRIIQKIETELNLPILMRDSRKKSGWTPEAYRLVEGFTKTLSFWEQTITELNPNEKRKSLRIATLGGLSDHARTFAKRCFDKLAFQTITVDILDLDWLESSFLKGDYDLILTVREPARRKFRFIKLVGYQNLQQVKKEGMNIDVLSSFEHQSNVVKKVGENDSKRVVSNSLLFRRSWIESIGGRARLPSEVRKKRSSTDSEDEVFWVGADTLREDEWKKWMEYL